tara:strand:- start:5471 stop:5692 length:222 start_codon:yes stop_codon:yes gene_type:complete
MASSLEDHEEICSQRYAEIDRRLTSVESKLDNLSISLVEKMDSNFRTMTLLIIGSMGAISTLVGIIVAVIGVK